MSKVGYALSICVLFTAACASTPQEPAGNEAPAGETPAAEHAGAQEGAGAAGQDALAQDRAKLSLEEQKKAVMLEQHIENARAAMKTLRFEDAESELVRALDIDPANLEAKQMLGEVSALLGKQPGEVSTIAQDMAQHYQVKVQQMQAQARQSMSNGVKAMARGDYERAIAEFSIAQNYIRWAPYSIDWQGLDKKVDADLALATSKRAEAEETKRKEAQKTAVTELREQEKAQRARQAAVVDNMVSQAIDAFDKHNYEEALDFADQALHEDPRNEKATEVRDAAFRAGRQQVRDDYVLQKREQFKRWQEELDKLRVPETGIYTLPDQDFWADITAKRAARRGIDLSKNETPAERELKAQVKSMHIPGLQVKDVETLSKVIDIIRTFTGLPLVVDPAADAAASDAGVIFNFNFTSQLSVEDALNIITKGAGPEVTWTVRHDAILVTTKAKARGKPVIYNHDVQDLVFSLTDFLGPRIDRLRLLDEMTDDDGGGPFGGIGEKPKLIEISALSTLIQENVAVGTWEQEGVSIAEGEGYILVVHTAEVQEQVRSFLNDLRRFGSSLVTIESKFMTVSSNWLQEIGVDFRGLDNPVTPFKDLDDVTNGLEDGASRGLDNGGLGAASGIPSSGMFYDDGQDGDFKARTENIFSNPLGNALSTVGGMTAQLTFFNDLQVSAILRAVEKSTDYQLINNQVLSVHNTQRAYVSVVNQRAYIQDFDVEVAQFQAVADPQINVLNEGVVLDVRPTIHHNRKYLTLEIQPTVAKVVALRTFSSTLGGNTSPVEFQLPELEVQSVFTTAVIPDGGSILLGGLSNIRNLERRAEVPWLAKLPLVGWLFKQEGYSEESKSLMILIRAHITDAQAEVTKLEGMTR
jgi:Flp pilus assembly secretin CpaC/tetratricopeptide (TPR) repeat protein